MPADATASAGSPLLEREDILDELRRVAERAVGGDGEAVLIEGPAGIGKTSLLGSAVELWQASGLRPLSARGGEIERELPWSVVRELLEPALRDRSEDELFTGAAALAKPVVRNGAAEPPADPEAAAAAALHGLYWLLANLCEERPTALIVDDAHWADAPSLRFVLYLAQRVSDLPLALVLAARPGEPGSDRAALGRYATTVSVLRPRPLSRGAVSILVERGLEAQPAADFARACHEITQGNPFLVRELVDALRREDTHPDSSGLARLRGVQTSTISSSVLLRLGSLPPDARKLAAAVAVLQSATLGRASRMAGLAEAESDRFADALVEMEILGAELPLSFVHPLVRSAVYEALAPAERARLHGAAAAELAAADAPAAEIAVHLAGSEPHGDPTAVAVLRRAAGEALAQGAPELAVAHLRRALREPPADDERVEVLVELAEAEAIAGSDDAIQHLDEALGAVGEARERARVSLRLGWMLCRSGRLAEGCEALRAAIEDLGDADRALGRELEAAYLANAWQIAEHAGDVRRRQRELLAGAQAGSTRPLLAQSALARVFAGEERDELIGDCRALLDSGVLDDESADSLTFWVAVGCLSWSDALGDSERAIESAFEDARRRGSPVATAWAYYARSWPRLWRGTVSEAAADAQAAVEAWSGGWGMYLPAAKYWLAAALIERDELDEAETALELPDEDRWSATTMHLLWTLGRGELAAARGRHEEAVALLLEAGERCEGTFRIENPSLIPWRSVAATALLRLGRREEASELAEAELELARRFGAQRALGAALRVAGAARGGAAGLEALSESVAVLSRSPAKLEHARSLAGLGGALRRAGQRSAAREQLARALDAASRLGALALARRIEDELRIAGARPGRRELSGPESLTPSERRVCELAAAGQTNREIAQELFVSLRTVETHLTHAYGKLEIESRRELAAALARNSADPRSVPPPRTVSASRRA